MTEEQKNGSETAGTAEPEAGTAAGAQGAPETGAEGATEQAADPQVEIERLQALVMELKEQLARSLADWENYKKRIAREREELMVFANQKLILNLLPVLDNLDRALATQPTAGDEKLRQGVELTARSFRELLAKEGVTEIEAAPGQPFDPNIHEAVMTVENPEFEDDQIVMEFQKGYKLGDRVIRPSRVQVNKTN
jgi:molecular chaperone GrpE